MNFLQTVVYRALLKKHDESYAREFATERLRGTTSLWNLDSENLDAVAAELRCTRAELAGFMLIDRAISNGNPCR